MQPAKISPVRQKLELVTEEHCSCCRDALASAAHELKTPLAIMGGYLHLLLTEKLGPLSPRQIEVLTEMQANGVRLSNFIQNLLTYTSLKVDRLEMHYELGDINDCIREIAEVWSQRFHDKAIAFYFLPNDKLEQFPFDYYKVQHVVSNLLDNAMKYTPSSGTVWLHVEPYFWERRTVSRPPLVERRKERVIGPNCCRISVSDTGPGIAPEFQQEIFEEYFRLTTQGTRAEGYGLGLAIARRLVQSAGGKDLGRKRTRHRQQVLFPGITEPPAQARCGGAMSTGHILVVDDEPSMLRYLQTVLELDSYRVTTASNGLEAVEKVQRDSPDLVLLDMVMPGADGLETLQRIRETRPSTKVVMLSCVRDTRKVAQAMRLGAQDYLSKPVQKEEMDEVLRFCLENTDPAAPGAGEAIEVSQGVYFFSATPQMRQLRAHAMQVAKFDFPVLILGESGTGKEVLAQLIHKYSDRAHRTFLKVNCAAVPSELLESELFGYEPGAFTGANKAKPGKFELCNKGTLLLDEIGEMSPALQAKLLQVLQDGQFSRLGGRNTVKSMCACWRQPTSICRKPSRRRPFARISTTA